MEEELAAERRETEYAEENLVTIWNQGGLSPAGSQPEPEPELSSAAGSLEVTRLGGDAGGGASWVEMQSEEPEELTPEQVDLYWSRLAKMKEQFEPFARSHLKTLEE